MSNRYWKAIVRYGHLGVGREVSVARYICTESSKNIIDAYAILNQMPGSKSRAVQEIIEITFEIYCSGKHDEAECFYLQSLMNWRRSRIHKRYAAA